DRKVVGSTCFARIGCGIESGKFEGSVSDYKRGRGQGCRKGVQAHFQLVSDERQRGGVRSVPAGERCAAAPGS
ncbi:hypothetical protein JZ751_010629, partial [Albula glossodonta]